MALQSEHWVWLLRGAEIYTHRLHGTKAHYGDPLCFHSILSLPGPAAMKAQLIWLTCCQWLLPIHIPLAAWKKLQRGWDQKRNIVPEPKTP